MEMERPTDGLALGPSRLPAMSGIPSAHPSGLQGCLSSLLLVKFEREKGIRSLEKALSVHGEHIGRAAECTMPGLVVGQRQFCPARPALQDTASVCSGLVPVQGA
jgi:hypothetical protein